MSVLVSLELIQVTCARSSCGVTFGLAKHHHTALRDSHNSFYCPNGHMQSYPQETVEEKLKRELEWETAAYKRACVRADREARSHTATKGHLTRVKKRAHNGVCIHCNRTFPNLSRHMKSKHAEECAP
jgi:hypothetical protein